MFMLTFRIHRPIHTKWIINEKLIQQRHLKWKKAQQCNDARSFAIHRKQESLRHMDIYFDS